MDRWQAELAAIGHPVHELDAAVAEASRSRTLRPDVASRAEMRDLVEATLAPDSALSRRKVFARKGVVVAVAPALFGCTPMLSLSSSSPASPVPIPERRIAVWRVEETGPHVIREFQHRRARPAEDHDRPPAWPRWPPW